MPKARRKTKARTVPYVRGFHAPTEVRSRNAIINGPAKKYEHLPKEYKAEREYFQPVPKCTSIDDWLAQYQEDGQTYKQFLMECPWLSTIKPKYIKMAFKPDGDNLVQKYPEGRIYIVPIECKTLENPSIVPNIDTIIEYTEIFLGLPVTALPPICVEAKSGVISLISDNHTSDTRRSRSTDGNLKCRYNKESGNYQLHISDLLLKLRKMSADDAICLVALTMFDLYEDPSDLFVAGMAAGNHRVAVFSLLRYDPTLSFSQEFWYDIRRIPSHGKDDAAMSDEKRRRLVLQRSCKLVVHEIGHLLGLDHCIFFSCCMNGAGHLEEDFRQPLYLCPVDLRKLHTLTGVNVIQRYRRLCDFYEREGMKAEQDWVQRRLVHLTSE